MGIEIVLSDQLQSLVAFDSGGKELDLSKIQIDKIISAIRPHCSGCSLCSGIGSITSSGHAYSKDGSVSVPAACPANGETVTV
ncbi:MAG: hypothetical protein WA152_01225 [Microgenomates group bacterium]